MSFCGRLNRGCGGERVNLDDLHVALTCGVMETRLTAPEWEEVRVSAQNRSDNRIGGGGFKPQLRTC